MYEWENKASCIKCFQCSHRAGKHYTKARLFTIWTCITWLETAPPLLFFRSSPRYRFYQDKACKYAFYTNLLKILATCIQVYKSINGSKTTKQLVSLGIKPNSSSLSQCTSAVVVG